LKLIIYFYLFYSYQYAQRLDQLENKFNQVKKFSLFFIFKKFNLTQNLSIYDEMISKNTIQIQNEINQTKQFVKLTRQRKEKIETVVQSMHNCLIEVNVAGMSRRRKS